MKIFSEFQKPSVFDRNETYVWLLKVQKLAEVRRKTVRQLLAMVTETLEDDITLHTTPLGKPFLPGVAFDWNVSYSSHHLAFGMSFNSRIGIDIEDTSQPRAFNNITSNFFTPHERAQSITPQDFYTIWTAKESLMKSIGLGFNLDPKKFSLTVGDDGISVDEITGYQKEDFQFATVLQDSIRLCVCQFKDITFG